MSQSCAHWAQSNRQVVELISPSGAGQCLKDSCKGLCIMWRAGKEEELGKEDDYYSSD